MRNEAMNPSDSIIEKKMHNLLEDKGVLRMSDLMRIHPSNEPLSMMLNMSQSKQQTLWQILYSNICLRAALCNAAIPKIKHAKGSGPNNGISM
jgi:hypothetical protein